MVSVMMMNVMMMFEECVCVWLRWSEVKWWLWMYRFVEAEASEGARARRNGNAWMYVGGYFDGFEICGWKKESVFDDGCDV